MMGAKPPADFVPLKSRYPRSASQKVGTDPNMARFDVSDCRLGWVYLTAP